jgi:hypothetical protein
MFQFQVFGSDTIHGVELMVASTMPAARSGGLMYMVEVSSGVTSLDFRIYSKGPMIPIDAEMSLKCLAYSSIGELQTI